VLRNLELGLTVHRPGEGKAVVLPEAPFKLAKLGIFELFRHLRLGLLLHLKLHVAQHPEESRLAAAALAAAACLDSNHLLGHREDGVQTVRCAACACERKRVVISLVRNLVNRFVSVPARMSSCVCAPMLALISAASWRLSKRKATECPKT